MMLLSDIPDKLAVTSFIYQMYNYFTKAERSAITRFESLAGAGETQKQTNPSPSATSPFDMKRFEIFRLSPVPGESSSVHSGMGKYSRHSKEEACAHSPETGNEETVPSVAQEEQASPIPPPQAFMSESPSLDSQEPRNSPENHTVSTGETMEQPQVSSDTVVATKPESPSNTSLASSDPDSQIEHNTSTISGHQSPVTIGEPAERTSEQRHSPVTIGEPAERTSEQQAEPVSTEVVDQSPTHGAPRDGGDGDGGSSVQQTSSPKVTPKTYQHVPSSRSHKRRDSDSSQPSSSQEKQV